MPLSICWRRFFKQVGGCLKISKLGAGGNSMYIYTYKTDFVTSKGFFSKFPRSTSTLFIMENNNRKRIEAFSSSLLNSLFCVEMLYTIIYWYHVSVCVSDVTSGDIPSGFIALKAKLTLVSSIQHHLLKNGR